MDSLAHKFTDRAFSWIAVYVPRIALALIIFFIGQWVIRLITRWARKVLTGKRVDLTLQPFLQNLFSIVLQVLLLLGIMQVLGIQMTIFAALIGVLMPDSNDFSCASLRQKRTSP